MKVLLLTPDLRAKGGVSAFCAALRNSFTNEVDFFTTGSRQGAESRVLAPLRLVFDYLRFVRILMRHRYDVIQVNPSFRIGALGRDAGFVLLAKVFRKKIVVLIHGWDKEFERKLRAGWLWLFRCPYFRADAFIVLARDFKGRLESMGYRGPIYLGRTAIDSWLSLLAIKNESALPVSPRPFNVLFLSRIVRAKGITEALEGFGILRSRTPDVTMTVAGDGEGLGDAKKLVAERKIPGVRFVGYVSGEDKARELRQAHCYLFPSHEEGMPISVLEAMAFGLPVIARPVGALADFFKNGVMGYLTESQNPAVYADLMQKLLNDPIGRGQMSRYNTKYALEQFSASAVTALLEGIYADVVCSERDGLERQQ